MLRYLVVLLGFAAPALATAPYPTNFADVVRVLDGDTVVVRFVATGAQLHVRLAYMDAPELVHGPLRPAQPGGVQAGRVLRSLLPAGSRVLCQQIDTDVYLRPVCVLIRGGTEINLVMVALGHAWVDHLASGRAIAPYYEAQRAAERQRFGLWSARFPVEPWVWRRDCWDTVRKSALMSYCAAQKGSVQGEPSEDEGAALFSDLRAWLAGLLAAF